MESKRVIVIGGGAAGMMAALSASQSGASILLLEKMPKLGLKLQITGKGRCNLTNIASPINFMKQFSDRGRFLKPSFYKFSNRDLMGLFEDLGVSLKVERGGRVFPVSDSAKQVYDALYDRIKRKGVKIKTSTSVKRIIIENNKALGAEDKSGTKYLGDTVVLASGGASYPSTGSSGDGYRMAKAAGHSIIEARPALVPVETQGRLASLLQGLSLKNIDASIYLEGKKINTIRGEMLFTHYGLSGPAIISLSSEIIGALDNHKMTELSIDMKPALDHDKLDKRLLRDLDKNGRQKIKKVLKNIMPSSMISVCLDFLEISPDKYGNQISSEERKKLRIWLKDLRFTVKGARPLDEAIVTAGGVSTREIDKQTMASRLIENMFFAGEIIDIDARTGGYNLQAAFSTGWAAGEASSKQ